MWNFRAGLSQHEFVETYFFTNQNDFMQKMATEPEKTLFASENQLQKLFWPYRLPNTLWCEEVYCVVVSNDFFKPLYLGIEDSQILTNIFLKWVETTNYSIDLESQKNLRQKTKQTEKHLMTTMTWAPSRVRNGVIFFGPYKWPKISG